MDFLVLIIVIIAIVAKVKKKDAKKRPVTTSQVNRNTQAMRGRQQTVSRQNVFEQQSIDKQKALKHRLEQKYGESSGRQNTQALQQKKKTVPHQQSILERAISHAEEESQDKLKQKDAVYHKTTGSSPEPFVPEVNNTEKSALMDKVYDLMITGYNGNLAFERDFLAEGVDMLNRMQEEPENDKI